MQPRLFKRFVAVALAALMVVNALPIGVVKAGLITTDQVLAETTAKDDQARLEQFLSRDDVRQQMVMLGVDPAEAEGRVASLSDAEIAQIAGRLDELPAGESAVGAVVGAAVLVFLVLLLTDLLGLTDVFPFVKK